MDRKKLRSPLGIVLILIGAIFLLTACSEQLPPIPVIPVTALKEITPAGPFARIVMGILGFILLVAGFSLVKVLIQLIGFFGGGAVGLFLVQIWWPASGPAAIIGFAIGGLIGVAIAMTATNVGVFIIGFLVGVSLAQQIWPFIEGVSAPWYGLILGGVLGGILTSWLFSYWVAALTSLIGAVILGIALNLQPVYWTILLIAGILIQTVFSRMRPGESK